MPTKPADVTSDAASPDTSASDAPADAASPDTSASDAPASDAPSPIRVSVPQQDGTIIINTFDTKAPHRYTVSGGVIDAPSQADADLLVARVDGAKLT